MKIYMGEDYKGMSRKAANIISAQINRIVYWDLQQGLHRLGPMINL